MTTPKLNKRLSYSRGYSFDKCKRAYKYQYVDELSPAPGTQSVESWIKRGRGILIHAGVEAAFNNLKPIDGIKNEIHKIEFPEYGTGYPDRAKAGREIADECAQVAQDVLDWLPASNWEPIVINGQRAVEIELSCAISGFKDFMGYSDLIARHVPTGRVMLIDWKTTERFGNPEDEIYRLQFLLYMHALKEMGVHVDGALVVQLKPEMPKGKPRKVREDVGGIDGPRESICGRFQSTPTLFSAEYVENVWRSFDRKAQLMAAFKPEDEYANISAYSCGFCEFKSLCQAQLNGEDVEHVLRTKFVNKKKKPLEVIL